MIRVQQEDFDVGAEMAALAQGKTGIGGIVAFVGLVRDLGSDGQMSALTLEHYPGMTERQLENIDAQAHQRWPLTASLIIHRYGRLAPGEQIVLVLTASAHRDAAFDANRFLIDWLKTKAPFWKSEVTATGSDWVKAQGGDEAAAARWDKQS